MLYDPQCHGLTHQARAAAAHLSSSRYYEILADQWFKEQEKQLAIAHLHGELGPIMEAMIETAKRPGRDGHADRRVVAEITGIYEPRKQLDHTHTVRHVGVIVGVMHDEL